MSVHTSVASNTIHYDFQTRVWPVGALCLAIADTLQARFTGLAVEGELTGFSRAASGHCYFAIKDGQGQLRCAMFRRAASLMPNAPRDGDRVQVRGRLEVYAPRGELQMIVESLHPAGQGVLFEQFLRLKASLQAEGLFDAVRKRPLPLFPKAIGLVTSLGAAALRDVVTTLQRRAPHVQVVVANAQVQGALAATEIRLALQKLQGLTDADGQRMIDLIVLARGGGAIEDLWAFNDEALARAIASCPLPVVTGVGHETDFTIADFVADVRAATPTAAAELVSQSQAHWLAQLEQQKRRLHTALLRRLDQQSQRLDGLVTRLGRPSDRLMQERQGLARLHQSLDHAVQIRLTATEHELVRLAPRLAQQVARQTALREQGLIRLGHALKVLDPGHVLRRGFAWLQNDQGQALTGIGQVQAGQGLTAHLSDGHLQATVQTVHPAITPS